MLSWNVFLVIYVGHYWGQCFDGADTISWRSAPLSIWLSEELVGGWPDGENDSRYGPRPSKTTNNKEVPSSRPRQPPVRHCLTFTFFWLRSLFLAGLKLTFLSYISFLPFSVLGCQVRSVCGNFVLSALSCPVCTLMVQFLEIVLICIYLRIEQINIIDILFVFPVPQALLVLITVLIILGKQSCATVAPDLFLVNSVLFLYLREQRNWFNR